MKLGCPMKDEMQELKPDPFPVVRKLESVTL